MPTWEEAVNQPLVLGIDGAVRFLSPQEITELPHILREKEIIDNIVETNYIDWFWGAKKGILVATNLRVMFVGKNGQRGATLEDFAYRAIDSVQHYGGFFSGGVKLFISGKEKKFEGINKEAAAQFADAVRQQIQAHTQPATSKHAPAHQSSDVLPSLERIATLRDQGHLTQEEFDLLKRRLLD